MNLLELRSWLQTQTLIPFADGVVDSYLNQAYIELASAYDWPWLETTGTINLEAGTSSYELPADLSRLRVVIYESEGAHAQPTRTTREAMLARYGGDVPSSSLPSFYYRSNRNLVFVPTPDTAQDALLVYLAKPTPLAADEDEPAFDSAFHVYLAQAAAALYFEAEESFEYANLYNGKAGNTFARLVEFYDLQLPPEQPFIIGAGIRLPRPLPFVGWETDNGV